MILAMARPKTDFTNYRLRLPPAMYSQISEAASQAGRSINSEMLYRLGRTLDPRWAEYIAALDERDRARKAAIDEALSNPQVQEWFDTHILPKLPALEASKRQADIAALKRKLARLVREDAVDKDVDKPKPR